MGTPMPIERSKDEYHQRASAAMDRHLAVPKWSTQQKLALACRMLAAEGHGSGLAGQVTARGAEPGTYWTMCFGLGQEESTASSVLLVDDDLQVLQGEGMPNPANRFHLWIYRARPAVN